MPPLPETDYLDCTAEVCPVRTAVPADRAWLAADVQRRDWFIPLDAGALEEIRSMAGFILDNPLKSLQRRPADFLLERCRRAVARMKAVLDSGVGFAVLDRLPLDEYPIETMVEVYWVLGQLIGRPVAQKWSGEMIYDVSDSGEPYSYGVRGSRTNVELVFHTDNAFSRVVPDYVGLLCRYPAVSGGVSRFCSLYSVHQRMLERFPDELERLYQPMYYDRQKEHAAGAAKVCLAPYFSWRGDRLYARANSSLIRKGHDVAGVRMDQRLSRALDAIDAVCADQDLWFEAAIERGQIQYLNNHEVGHYRSDFVDHPDPEKRRHLFRLWHRDEGSACYDGVVCA